MLAHSIVTARSTDPEQYMLFLHGILGTRANWRGIARTFVEARPAWGAVLVDLREHGDSLGMPTPHTVSAAATDVAELERFLDVPVGGALGHSFGGKVVLEWLRSRQGVRTEAWTIDSSPSPSAANRDTTATAEVMRTLENLPRHWVSREAFVAAVIAAGQPPPIAQWLAMNLRRTDDGKRTFGPDLDVIRELVEDYARTDSWDVVDALPNRCSLDVVIGGRSEVFSQSDRARIQQIARQNSAISVHVLHGAGHWVQVDAPDALVALFMRQREW
ncbi:MAG: alpha/beta hydrolase [Deltaproteobacteria bacterium]|nr:alpha/beta hydrolase [Deltaproteobacteria bacterium]